MKENKKGSKMTKKFQFGACKEIGCFKEAIAKDSVCKGHAELGGKN